MTDAAKATLHKILKDNGYSTTAARLTVCELLWQQEPQSIHDVIARSQGRLDRASVYRTLTLFEQLGLTQRVYIGWKYKVELSDVLAHHHHHLSCIRCGKVSALRHEADFDQHLAALAAAHGFTATSHQLEIQGVCTACTAAPAVS